MTKAVSVSGTIKPPAPSTTSGRSLAGGIELLHVDGDAGPPRRLMRGDRLGQHIGLGQDAVGRDLGQPAHDRGIGLRIGYRPAPASSSRRRAAPTSQADNDRLADIGVGAGDEKALHSGRCSKRVLLSEAGLYRANGNRGKGEWTRGGVSGDMAVAHAPFSCPRLAAFVASLPPPGRAGQDPAHGL